MNIGIVCYPTYGGSGVVATELGNALADKGHKVHFISYDLPVRMNSFNPNIFFHQVRVSDYPLFEYPPYEVVLTSKIVDVTKYENLDLLHVHYAIPHASAAYMAQQILNKDNISLPIITTLHGTDITLLGKDASFEPVISYAINHSNAVTAVSESLKEDTLELFHIDKEIQVIYNFICTQKYDTVGSSELKARYAPNKEKLLIHISNFRKVKRIGDIVKAFAKIKKEVPSKLLLVGDGPERNHVENLVRELGVCEDVVFFGHLKSSMDLLAISDLFMLASNHESFGLSALEAMASGTPVVSTNVGGIPEVNKDGYTGYTNDVGDVESMALNAIKILTSEEKLNVFKKNARANAETFTIRDILPQYEELYQKCINESLVSN